ncbi:tripartite tricarboxylate transporter substrate binding protein [Alcaligenaceae bacterium]|nr:tripartite tricarboxylate transporter substrate binding protein [Alcaligenaceae bacterium]
MSKQHNPFRKVAQAVLYAAMLAPISWVGAQTSNTDSQWPTRSVNIIVPYPPGGATDISARIISKQMEKHLKMPFVIVNRPGGGGNVGAQAAVNAPADGYTLLFGTQGLLTANPYLYENMTYDIRKDFVPLGLTYDIPHLLVVNKSVPAQTPQEFVSLAKSKPGEMSYGSSGMGGGTHLFAEYFLAESGIDMLHVPYQGSGPAKTDLVGGRIDAMFDALSSIASLVKSGEVRALAVTSANRHPDFPDIPTLSETVQPGFDTTTWGAMLAPVGTPPAIAEQISARLLEVLQDKETQKLLAATGTLALPSTKEETAKKIEEEDTRWKKVIADIQSREAKKKQ